MWRRTWLVFAQAVTVAVALLFVLLTFKPEWLPRGSAGGMLPSPTIVQVEAAPRAQAGASAASGAGLAQGSLAAAARRAAPAVVSITADRLPRNHPPLDGPWQRFNGQRGLGSGVIVSPEGYLLTNHHVVAGASQIEVQLPDGRSASASLVGSDEETDIAVLRIELAALPVVAFGDTRALQVGDVVLAIGNPFNIGQTVTAGIVSALDRTEATNNPFQSFIQTDAAINPGNSGGALVDANGNLVGINTAIFGRTGGGNLGIGFAVPVDTARMVMEALIRGGSVERGWIGVQMRSLNPELAEALSLPIRNGVLVAGVLEGGPAERGGMKPGDVVTGIGGKAVTSDAELVTAISSLKPGSKAELQVQRGADRLRLELTLGQRPPRSRQVPR